ncbi:unnamed protein product [Miscanthus lutarioriparius]|uniref:Uncharacterized protein n=1 Tax=Miscanthus lutarioriparius TaxID=422564 RepID=A0A811MAT8_9POAL|nr:unnamed protein product [Miscanthus lutarioriparius]
MAVHALHEARPWRTPRGTRRSAASERCLRLRLTCGNEPSHAATAVAAAAHAAAAACATPTPSATTAAATNSLLRQCAHVKGPEADSKDISASVSTSCSCLLRIPDHHRPQNVGDNTSMEDALNVFDEMGTRFKV